MDKSLDELAAERRQTKKTQNKSNTKLAPTTGGKFKRPASNKKERFEKIAKPYKKSLPEEKSGLNFLRRDEDVERKGKSILDRIGVSAPVVSGTRFHL